MGELLVYDYITIKANEDFEETWYFPYDFSTHTADGAIKTTKDATSELLALTCAIVPQASIAADDLATIRAVGDLTAQGGANWATATITGIKASLTPAQTKYPGFNPSLDAQNRGFFDVYSTPSGGLRKRRVQGYFTLDRNIKQ